jgi:predicted NBD/HSP70 family sugar kinase
MIYVRWSSGVGGGVVVDGRLIRGAHGIAGQIGHVSVDADGESCQGCGGRGCLDPRIRTGALLETLEGQGVRLSGIDDFIAKAREGDEAVRSVLAAAARDLGVALSRMAIHLDPKRIVVGGELAVLGEVALEQVRETVRQLALPSAPRRLELVPAMFGPEAAALGAVALLLDDRVESVGKLSRLRGATN